MSVFRAFQSLVFLNEVEPSGRICHTFRVMHEKFSWFFLFVKRFMIAPTLFILYNGMVRKLVRSYSVEMVVRVQEVNVFSKHIGAR